MIPSKTIAKQEDRSLAQCLEQIELKVGWGSSVDWSTGDFERLSEQIAEETGVCLSVTTLKRVWGRVKYASAPTETTLNALAAFAGYQNWRDFRCAAGNWARKEEQTAPAARAEVVPQPEPSYPAPALSTPLSRTRSRWWIGAGGVALLAGVLLFFQNHVAPRPPDPKDFSFSSRHVTKGIPNSVVFTYDASASPTDSVFIQQSWDSRRRRLVPKNGREHTSIYYYPGYFRAKLVVGGRVVQEHDLYIPSEDWVVAVKQEPVPVYFDRSLTVRNGVLHLPVAEIERQNIPMQPKPPAVRYRHVPDLKGLRNDNFVFETRLRSDFKTGSAVCQKMEMFILCQEDIFAIPLCAKGCVADLGLYLAGYNVQAGQADLSGFGFEADQWVTLRCEVRDRHVQLFVNGKKAHEATFPNKPTPLVGISYEFEGTGSVDYTRFSRPDGEVVYEDDFNALEARASSDQ